MTHPTEPWHAGERAVQTRAGSRERMAEIGPRVLRDAMPEQHRLFFAELPFLVLGSVGADGAPWASIVAGTPGFAHAPDPRTLTVAAAPTAGDPLAANLALGAPIAALGIQLETRRRNRANGRVASVSERGFVIGVEQSFGNCPQYIHVRELEAAAPHAPGEAQREGARLSAAALQHVRDADTFFIATASEGGADVSHRGGPRGFVHAAEVDGAAVLTFPDYRGNFYFNTLGNLHANPRAGLLFPDFATGDVLTLTGRTEVIWDGPELADFLAAQRVVRFTAERGVLLRGALPFRVRG
jgi:predicted pyridoxine 5'-phosphate oxidase superfamily flavin-nucleotide-binding protein